MKDIWKDLAAMRPGVTPVPMPNTTVKTRTADGTALETVRESRWPPEQKKSSGHGAEKESAAEPGGGEAAGRTLKTAYTKKASYRCLELKQSLQQKGSFK